MEAAGVEIRKFHEPRWYNLNKLNNRTHRKLLVVDGAIGFTGGVGIASEWTGHAQDPDALARFPLPVEGPVVAQMQAVFADNWVKATGDGAARRRLLSRDRAGRATAPAQMFASSPSGGSESMELMYLLIDQRRGADDRPLQPRTSCRTSSRATRSSRR